MVTVDISKNNLVQISEIQSAAKGYAQKMTMKRTKEKIYYGLWRKAFETAIKKSSNKNNALVSYKCTDIKGLVSK